jgi:hypothetical protein
MQIEDCPLPTADCGLLIIVECRFIAACRLSGAQSAIRNQQSTTSNLQSPICNLQSASPLN